MEYNWTDEQSQGTMGTEELEQLGQQELSPMNNIGSQLGMYITV